MEASTIARYARDAADFTVYIIQIFLLYYSICDFVVIASKAI